MKQILKDLEVLCYESNYPSSRPRKPHATFNHDRPKCLLEVNGKSLLEHQFEAITEAGIRSVAIVTGYKQELIKLPGVELIHSERY